MTPPMRHVVIGTSGHIDHGKSTLVLALTGTDPDRLKEEKARGITIDLGFAHYVDGDVVISLVDVPGHERFVKNMLAGATGIDGVMLVIAADESVMPQTREHFAIATLLGVGRGVVVLTKADLVDTDTLELVHLEARELVAGSFLEGAPIIAVSARTGAGLDALRAALRALATTTAERRSERPFRLPIDRVFTVRGFGTVVTGTVASGMVAPEDELESLRDARRVKVRGVHVHGQPADRAVAGQRAAVNLGGVDLSDLVRGDTLAAPAAFRSTRRFDATLRLLPDAKPLKHGTRVRVHQGTSEVLGRVALGRSAGPDETVARAEVQPGEGAYVRVRLERDAVIARGDRYVIRAYSPPVTIAGGLVLDSRPPRNGTRSAAQLARMRALDPGEQSVDDVGVRARAAMVGLEEAGARGVSRAELLARWAIPSGELAPVEAALVANGHALAAGAHLLASPVATAIERAVVSQLQRHHHDEPLSLGLPREEVRTRACGVAPPDIFDLVMARLVASGQVVDRDRVALSNHRVALSDADGATLSRVEACFAEAGLRPPDRATLEAAVGAPSAAIDRVLQVLARQKVLVRLDTLWFHMDALNRLKDEVRGLKANSGGVDVAMFKERYGVTRKFAIPLLEYLDRERVTRRVGDKRIVL